MKITSFDKTITGLLVVDPYNDFISEGGKIWPRIKAVAEANNCVSNMREVLIAARKANLRIFYAMHHRYRPGDYETWKYIAPLKGAASGAGGSPVVGVTAMLAGCISYAVALVYARRFVAPLNLSPVKLAAYQMLFAVVLLAPFAAPGHWNMLAADVPALLALVFGLGLIGTGIAFVIYYQLIQTLGAMKAASVYYIPPVVALIVGWAALGETITPIQAGGAVLVMTGIFYANRG